MQVTFTRTGPRRYRIAVEGPNIPGCWMEPAPGYDDELPHDVAHFIVENEFGLKGGVFGQLAAGGTAKTFHSADPARSRKFRKRGEKIAAGSRGDAVVSERLVALAWAAWKGQPDSGPPVPGLTAERLGRIRGEFERVSRIWSALPVGGSLTLEWRHKA